MEKDPHEVLADVLFFAGLLVSLTMCVLPDRPKSTCTGALLWCRCNAPTGPTGNPALDEAWKKARE